MAVPEAQNHGEPRCRTLSGGEQQMLTVEERSWAARSASSWMNRRQPSAIVAQLLGDQIRKLKDERYTLLMAEQNALLPWTSGPGLCDRQRGHRLRGPREELKQNREMMREYLGV